jgi:hypothetical protein
MQGIEAEAGVHFLRANTAEEFAAQMAWAAAHPGEAQHIAAAGRTLVSLKYDAGEIMHRLTDALQELTGV